MPKKKLNEITLEDAAKLEPKRKFVPKEEEEEEVDIANPRKKSKQGTLKPGSPINGKFILEAKYIGDAELAGAVHNLKVICRKKRCPMFVYFDIPKDDDFVEVSDFITREEMNMKHIKEDPVLQHIKITKGFTAVEKDDTVNVEDFD